MDDRNRNNIVLECMDALSRGKGGKLKVSCSIRLGYASVAVSASCPLAETFLDLHTMTPVDGDDLGAVLDVVRFGRQRGAEFTFHESTDGTWLGGWADATDNWTPAKKEGGA